MFRIVKAFKYYILIAGKVRPPVLDIEPPFLSKISSLKLPPSVLMQMFPHRHIWCDLETLKQVSPGPQTHAISAGICFFKHRGTQQSENRATLRPLKTGVFSYSSESRETCSHTHTEHFPGHDRLIWCWVSICSRNSLNSSQISKHRCYTQIFMFIFNEHTQLPWANTIMWKHKLGKHVINKWLWSTFNSCEGKVRLIPRTSVIIKTA